VPSPKLQSGAGLGSFLAGLFRSILPFLKSGGRVVAEAAKKAASSDVGKAVIQEVKSNAKKAAAKGVSRALKGEDVLSGAKADLKAAKHSIANAIERSAGANGSGKDAKKAKPPAPISQTKVKEPPAKKLKKGGGGVHFGKFALI